LLWVMLLHIKTEIQSAAVGPCALVQQTLEEEIGAWDSASKGSQSQEISSPGAGSTTSGDIRETSQGLPLLFHPTLCYP